MNEIQKSYLSLLGCALWSQVLFFIPLLIRFVRIKARKYTYDDRDIYIEEGFLTKNSMSIPLIKIETVQVRSNLLGNGVVNINSRAAGTRYASMHNLEFIKNAKQVGNDLTNAITNAREVQGIKTIDIF